MDYVKLRGCKDFYDQLPRWYAEKDDELQLDPQVVHDYGLPESSSVTSGTHGENWGKIHLSPPNKNTLIYPLQKKGMIGVEKSTVSERIVYNDTSSHNWILGQCIQPAMIGSFG